MIELEVRYTEEVEMTSIVPVDEADFLENMGIPVEEANSAILEDYLWITGESNWRAKEQKIVIPSLSGTVNVLEVKKSETSWIL